MSSGLLDKFAAKKDGDQSPESMKDRLARILREIGDDALSFGVLNRRDEKPRNPFVLGNVFDSSPGAAFRIDIDQTDHKGRLQAKEQLLEELSSGKIPECIIEAQRLLVDPPSELNPVVRDLNVVQDRLFAHTGLPPEMKPRVVISDHEFENAAIFTDARPPLLFVTRGLLKACETQDEIAGIIGHELGHLYLHYNFEIGRVTRGEESTADELAVSFSYKAGFDPRGIGTVFRRWQEQTKRRAAVLQVNILELLDVHADYLNRIRNTDDYVGVLGFKKDTHFPTTPLTAETKDALKANYFSSLISRTLDSDEKQGFKIHLKKLIEVCKYLSHKNEFLWQNSWNELEDKFRTLQPLSSKDKELLVSAHEYLARVEGKQAARLAEATLICCERHGVSILPKVVSNAINALLSSLAKPEEVISAAKTINEESPKLLEYSLAYLNKLVWRQPRIVNPSNYPIADWENAYTIGKSMGDNSVFEAFYRIGVSDPRLSAEYEKVRRTLSYPFLSRTNYTDCNNFDVTVSADGEYLVLNDSLTDRNRFKKRHRSGLLYSEQMLARERETAEKEALDSDIDWSRLESDMGQFITQYQELLTPFLSCVDATSKFERLFCEQLEGILQRDPQKGLAIIEKFFSVEPGSELRVLFEKDMAKYSYQIGIVHFEDRHDTEFIMRAFEYKQPPLVISLSRFHPYLNFIRKHPELFSLEQKAFFYSLCFSEQHELYNDTLGDMNISHKADLDRVAASLKEFSDKIKTNPGLGYTIANSVDKLRITAAVTFIEGTSPAYLDLVEYELLPIRIGASERLVHAVQDQVRRNTEVELKGMLPLNDLIEKFISYEASQCFRNTPETGSKYATHILTRIQSELAPEEQIATIERLLKEAKVRSARIRAVLIDQWASASHDVYGEEPIDDASASVKFKMQAEAMLSRLQGSVPAALVPVMAVRFLRVTVSQRDTNYYFRDELKKWAVKQGMSLDGWIRLADFSIGHLGDIKGLDRDILNFLSVSPDDAACSTFVKQLASKAQSARNGSSTTKNTRILGIHVLPTEGIEAYSKEDARIWEARNTHENFWSLPFEVRTLWLGRVAFPLTEDGEDSISKLTPKLVDQVFKGRGEDFEIAKKIALYMLDEYPPESRRLMVSALLAASPGGAEGDMRPGEVLVQVLSKFPGAGGRTLQAIHSYLNSLGSDNPRIQQLVVDLKETKSSYNQLLPWTVSEIVDDVVPEDVRNDFGRVGPSAGAGVYAQTVEVQYQGRKKALSLARTDIEEEGDYHFEVFARVAKRLADENSDWAPLEALVSSAKDSHETDSNFELRGRQAEYARKIYDQLTIFVDGYTFEFESVFLDGYGKRFVLTDFAEGEHFNDLVDTADPRYVKALAKAMIVAELYHLFSGKATDIDRHGAQSAVVGSKITVLDPGGIPIDKETGEIIHPSSEELLTLGKTLARFMKTRGGFAGVNGVFNQAKSDFGHSQYLDRTHRMFLALGDYFGQLGEPKDVKKFLRSAVLGILGTAHVHPQVLSGAGISNWQVWAARSARYFNLSSITVQAQRYKD